MAVSRRKFLTHLGTGAAVAATFPALEDPRFTLAAAEPGVTKKPVLLNSNENAYGCSEHVIKSLHEASFPMNRYPGNDASRLRDRIATMHHVKPEQVTIGCGSSEILHTAVLSFTGPGKTVVVASPTYEAVGRYAKTLGADVAAVSLNRDWAHDTTAMLAQVDERTSLVYICNPNNPTGSITPRAQLEEFIAKLPPHVYVIVDEAYHHYMNPSGLYVSFLERPVANPNVIVARTFSKIYGLAGMRIGYAVTSPEIAERLKAHQLYMSVSAASLNAALAALDDQASVEKCSKRNADDRQEFLNQVNARMLRAIDSHTNFVMVNVARPVEEVIEHFKQHDVLVGRKFSPLDTYLRVSLGQPHEMDQFWAVWDKMPGNMKM